LFNVDGIVVAVGATWIVASVAYFFNVSSDIASFGLFLETGMALVECRAIRDRCDRRSIRRASIAQRA
jgi:hypothetical protein